jgi:LPS sulfotransferase NodH
MRTHDGPDSRFIFILSTERSGSTLLSVMLGGHGRVVAPPELHLMAYRTVGEWLQQYPTAIKSLDFLFAACGLTMDREALEKTFAGSTPESLYRWLLAQASHRPRIIVDKTPKYARDIAALRRIETLEPLYVWLLRHPLGVAISQIDLRLQKRKQRNTELAARIKYPMFRIRASIGKREAVRKEVAYWALVNTQIEGFLSTIPPERKHRVHFEQLVKEPSSVMDGLCRWLDIPFEASMLDPGGHIPVAALDPTLADPKLPSHRTIDATVADSWRERCSERLLNRFSTRPVEVSPRQLMTRWGIA